MALFRFCVTALLLSSCSLGTDPEILASPPLIEVLPKPVLVDMDEGDPPVSPPAVPDSSGEMAWWVWTKDPSELELDLREGGWGNCEGERRSWPDHSPFQGMDLSAAEFLARPSLLSAVQFSCARGSSPEDRFREALDHDDARVRLQALTCLMKVRAPRSIDEQFRVLQELAVAGIEESGAELVRVLELEFSSERIRWLFEQNLPGGQDSNEAHLHWAIRAAGILQDPTHFARVAEWALSDNLDLNLAAERALEDYDGPEANRALLACVQAWRYDSSLRAASALMDRDPEALRRLLSTLDVRSRRRYWKGILLGRLQDPAAVPILIDEVGGVAIKDREMFDSIEALAGPEHRELIEALPYKVRPNQMERAVEVRRGLRARYGFPE